MDITAAWDSLAQAISDMHRPGGDYDLKLHTVMAGVELLFEFPTRDILDRVERSPLPTRALVSWLVFEGGRIPDVDEDSVQALRRLYEATCPPGQGIIPPPRPGAGRPLC